MFRTGLIPANDWIATTRWSRLARRKRRSSLVTCPRVDRWRSNLARLLGHVSGFLRLDPAAFEAIVEREA